MPLHLVIDTNAFYTDPHRQSEAFRVLEKGLDRTNVRLRIPKVVFEEVSNHFREATLAKYLAVRQAIENLNRHTRHRFPTNVVEGNPAADVDAFRAAFEQWISRCRGKILDYPRASHRAVVTRELLRKKPFKDNGSGYRDFLIWLNILQIAKSGSDGIYLVTANHRDFAEGDNLHPDLFADLNGLNCIVRIFKDLREFNNNITAPGLANADAERAKIVNDVQLISEFSDWLAGAIPAYVRDNQELVLESFGRQSTDFTIASAKVGEAKGVEVVEVRNLSKYQLLVDTVAEIRVTLALKDNGSMIHDTEAGEGEIGYQLLDSPDRVALSHIRTSPHVFGQFVYDF